MPLAVLNIPRVQPHELPSSHLIRHIILTGCVADRYAALYRIVCVVTTQQPVGTAAYVGA